MRARCLLGVPLRFIPLVLLTASVAACGGSGASASPPTPMAIDRSAAGTTVTLAPGQQLVISLPTNPSTGFSWGVGLAPDPVVLAQVGEQGYIPAGDSGAGQPRVGVGGTAVLTFIATGPGETGFTLVYQQPWAHDPADRFDLSVVVR